MKDIALFLLRSGFSLSMIPHGWGKLMKLIEGDHGFADPIGVGELPSLILAVFAEFFCSIFLFLGYKTKWASIPLIITMAVAAFVVHYDDPWGKKEKAFLFLVAYICVALLGPGKYSLDRK